MTASTSRAIAPHARTSTSGRAASKTRSSSGSSSGCSTASHDERLGGLRGDGCVATVRVRTDRLAELLVQRGATDEDDVVVANALLLQGLDDDLHVGHRRR